jgi:hypothetical protein
MCIASSSMDGSRAVREAQMSGKKFISLSDSSLLGSRTRAAAGTKALPPRVASSLPVFWVACALCLQACGSPREDEPSPSKIKIMMNLHLDPTDPQRFGSHRPAFLWVQQLAREKGFKITAEVTGSFADMAIGSGHVSDFTDFMPGKTHMLGEHIHPEYKGPEDVGVAGQWTQIFDYESADDATVQNVFNQNIEWTNKILTSLGSAATDNHLFHGTQMPMSRPLKLLGVEEPNQNSYPNVFDMMGCDSQAYHPYRSAQFNELDSVSSDVAKPFIVIPAGAVWMLGEHKPEGMVYGTLAYQQRYFILLYLEYWYNAKIGGRELPWAFSYTMHPHDVDTIVPPPDVDTSKNREQLAQFYDWLNQYFIGNVAEYATAQEIADDYKDWEEKYPGSQVYQDEAPNTPGLQNSTANLTYRIADALRDGIFYYVNMDKTGDTLLVEFANGDNDRALLVMPGANAKVDLRGRFSGAVDVVGCAETTTSVALADVETPTDPVLLIGK